jgi:lactoylglutathione lyase
LTLLLLQTKALPHRFLHHVRPDMAKPIHSNIRVLEEGRSVDFYRQAFDLDVLDRVTFDDFTLVFLGNPESEFELELTINQGRIEPYTHGTGYGHLALSVDDLEGEHDKCARLGLNPTPMKDLYSGGRLAVRFFFVTDPDGYKVEVVQRQGRYR